MSAGTDKPVTAEDSHGWNARAQSSDALVPPKASDTAPVERSAPSQRALPGPHSSSVSLAGDGEAQQRESGSLLGNLLQRIIAKHYGDTCAYGHLAIEQIRLQMEECA